jgi:hypothetical protein
MCHHYFPLHVDNQSKTVFVYRDQNLAVRGETKPCNVRPILEWQRLCDIRGQIEQINLVSNWGEQALVQLVGVVLCLLLCED